MSELQKVETLSNNPFKCMVATIGNLPTSFVDSMSYYELLTWLCNYIKNTVIPTVNGNAEAVKELQDKYLELKAYVDSYFENLDVQEEINVKLDAMAEDGTLERIINQEIFGELNDKIDDNADQIDANHRNSKYVAVIFNDIEARQTLAYITDFLTRSKNAGFKEAQMLIDCKADGTIGNDISKFDDYNEIADELNIPITSLKVHGAYSNVNYENNILAALSHFPHVETVFVFNEQEDQIYAHGLGLPASIKTNYSNVKKVGFTMSNYGAFRRNSITSSQWTTINNVYDVIGVNMYPSCGHYENANKVQYSSVIDMFNQCHLDQNIVKDVWITESGVLPYWQALEEPEVYNTSLFSDQTVNIEPQRIFYNALNDCDTAKRAVKICPWYMESGMSDENHELFDIFKNVIKNN